MLLLNKKLILNQLPPLSLYVHIPWCVSKCPYCDFNSHQLHGEIDESSYISALLSDLESDLPFVAQRSIQSVFIGGGTPSLLSGAAILRLLDGIRNRVDLVPKAEITIEANPCATEQEKFHAFSDAGVTRLSLGVQSFNDKHLQALGRVHSADDAWRAIDFAQSVFAQVNIDLMYGLPEQTLAQAQSDIDLAIASKVKHISAYHLTLEANTAFAVSPPKNLPSEDIAADMQCLLEERLALSGLEHYETSAFAHSDYRCQHNLNYWQFGDYLGIGAGAHSKLSSLSLVERSMRYKQPAAYLKALKHGDARQTKTVLDNNDILLEFMMNALRLSEGFSISLFRERTGFEISEISNILQKAKCQNLIEQNDDRIYPSIHGQRFLNDLLTLFLP